MLSICELSEGEAYDQFLLLEVKCFDRRNGERVLSETG